MFLCFDIYINFLNDISQHNNVDNHVVDNNINKNKHQLWVKNYHVNVQQHGLNQTWHPNGVLNFQYNTMLMDLLKELALVGFPLVKNGMNVIIITNVRMVYIIDGMKNGKIKHIHSYNQGQRHGLYQQFYNYGQLKQQSNFVYGKSSPNLTTC